MVKSKIIAVYNNWTLVQYKNNINQYCQTLSQKYNSEQFNIQNKLKICKTKKQLTHYLKWLINSKSYLKLMDTNINYDDSLTEYVSIKEVQ